MPGFVARCYALLKCVLVWHHEVYLSFPWFWPVLCCHFNMAVSPLDFTAEKQAEIFKGRFLGVKDAGLFPGNYNQLLKGKNAKSLWAVFSITFSHLSLLDSLMSLYMSGFWLQSFLSTPCGGSLRPLRLLFSLSSFLEAVQELWCGRTDSAVLRETAVSHHTFHYETKLSKKSTKTLWGS